MKQVLGQPVLHSRILSQILSQNCLGWGTVVELLLRVLGSICHTTRVIKEGREEERKQGRDNLYWLTIFKGLVPGQVTIWA